MILQRLEKTTTANQLFSLWYKANNWQLTVPLQDFMKLHFRYQIGIFEDFLAANNIAILATPPGWVSYIPNPNLVPEVVKDAPFITKDNGLWILGAKPEVDNLQRKKPAIMLTQLKVDAIVYSMELLNIIKIKLC